MYLDTDEATDAKRERTEAQNQQKQANQRTPKQSMQRICCRMMDRIAGRKEDPFQIVCPGRQGKEEAIEGCLHHAEHAIS
jgi:hypothetical protein